MSSAIESVANDARGARFVGVYIGRPTGEEMSFTLTAWEQREQDNGKWNVVTGPGEETMWLLAPARAKSFVRSNAGDQRDVSYHFQHFSNHSISP